MIYLIKKAKEKGCKIGVYAATTVGEETTMRGAHWASSRIKPDVAIAVAYGNGLPFPAALDGGPLMGLEEVTLGMACNKGLKLLQCIFGDYFKHFNRYAPEKIIIQIYCTPKM